jgi:excisionase family DNA binding protein
MENLPLNNEKNSADSDASENVVRVSVEEASRLFGVNTKTIRRAIEDQKIRYIVVNGRYKINFASLVKWSQESSLRKEKLSTEGIGQYVGQWKIKNRLYSPGSPRPLADTGPSSRAKTPSENTILNNSQLQ